MSKSYRDILRSWMESWWYALQNQLNDTFSICKANTLFILLSLHYSPHPPTKLLFLHFWILCSHFHCNVFFYLYQSFFELLNIYIMVAFYRVVWNWQNFLNYYLHSLGQGRKSQCFYIAFSGRILKFNFWFSPQKHWEVPQDCEHHSWYTTVKFKN